MSFVVCYISCLNVLSNAFTFPHLHTSEVLTFLVTNIYSLKCHIKYIYGISQLIPCLRNLCSYDTLFFKEKILNENSCVYPNFCVMLDEKLSLFTLNLLSSSLLSSHFDQNLIFHVKWWEILLQTNSFIKT